MFRRCGGCVFDVVGGCGSSVYVTGGMPRQLGVYIRITQPVWFHSFCS